MLDADSELTLQITDRLEANTEYSIFFAAKPEANGRLEFRLSGLKMIAYMITVMVILQEVGQGLYLELKTLIV